jgi:hypothetical protein
MALPAGRGSTRLRSWGLTRNRARGERSFDIGGAGASDLCLGVMGVLLRPYGSYGRLRKLGISCIVGRARVYEGEEKDVKHDKYPLRRRPRGTGCSVQTDDRTTLKSPPRSG